MEKGKKKTSKSKVESAAIIQENIEKKPVARKYKTSKKASKENTAQVVNSAYKTIGENIRLERANRNLTIEELAEMLELSASYIGLLERGERCPSLKNLYKLCDLFGCAPNDMLISKKNTSQKTLLSFAESKKDAYTNKYNTVLSLLKGMDEDQLDFIISSMKSLRNLKKKDIEK